MDDAHHHDQVEAMAKSLNALIAFADQEADFVLAATLESARLQFADRHLSLKN